MTEKIDICIEKSNLTAATVKLYDEHGCVQKKRVGVSVLAGLIDSSLKKTETVVYSQVGQIPKGYVDMAYSDSSHFKVVLRYPSVVRPYYYSISKKDRLFLIPFPETLFCFDIGGRRTQYCFAVNDKEQVCDYPFPNVYSSGKICWGGNTLPNISSLTDVESMAELFFNAPFNGHLYTSESTTLNTSIEGLLRHLETMDRFPSEILVSKNELVSNVTNDFLNSKGWFL